MNSLIYEAEYLQVTRKLQEKKKKKKKRNYVFGGTLHKDMLSLPLFFFHLTQLLFYYFFWILALLICKIHIECWPN